MNVGYYYIQPEARRWQVQIMSVQVLPRVCSAVLCVMASPPVLAPLVVLRWLSRLGVSHSDHPDILVSVPF